MISPEVARQLSTYERAVAYAEKSVPTEHSGHTQMDFFGLTKLDSAAGLWPDYRGKKILDVGAGASDYVARLLQRGADAYALDPKYYNVVRTSFEIARRKTLFLKAPFEDSLRQDPKRYVPGYAHDLRHFDSNSFDAVTSFYGIFGDVIDRDRELLGLSLSEALRILKPGGILKIGPYMNGSLSNDQKNNQNHVVESLQARESLIVDAVSPRSGFNSRDIDVLGQLTVFKSTNIPLA